MANAYGDIKVRNFFMNNLTSDSMKRQAKLSSYWGITVFFLNLSDLKTLSHYDCTHKTGRKLEG